MRYLIISLFALFILTGCLDSTEPEPYDDTADLEFLEEYEQQEDVNRTDSGLLYRVIEEGEGEQPGLGDIVSAHLVGHSIDEISYIFNTHEDGEPALLLLDETLIDGLREGLLLMNEGAIYEMALPTELAHFDGRVLFFEEVELVEILEPGEEATRAPTDLPSVTKNDP